MPQRLERGTGRRTWSRRALSVLLWTGLATGCAESQGELYRRDLLARSPEERIHQPGRILPSSVEDWGAVGFSGWERRGGRLFSVERVARLPLSVVETVDQRIELELRWPRGDPPLEREPRERRVRLRLNGEWLGLQELPAEGGRLSFEAPAALWRFGTNALELQAEPRPTAEGRASLQLLELTYADERRVRVVEAPGHVDDTTHARRASAARVLQLDRGTGVRYRVFAFGGDQLTLGARGAGALGELRVSLRDVGPTGLALPAEGPPLVVHPAADGALLARQSIAGPPRLVELELAWHGPGDEALTLERLEWVAAGTAPPPILFLSIDTLSARHLSLHGYPRRTSPALEAFAAEAITFEACRANAPRTMRSYASQFSGLFPGANRPPAADAAEAAGRYLTPREENQITPDRTSLAEALRAAGYRTGAWISNSSLAHVPGVFQGFEELDLGPSQLESHNPRMYAQYDTFEVAARRGLAWIRRGDPEQPWFCLVQAMDVHGPYRPRDPWRGTFAEDPLPDREHRAPVSHMQAHAYDQVPFYIAKDGREEVPESVRTAPYIDAYDEKIRELDEHLGEFFAELERSGILERAIVVLSADHGESMLEHHFFFGHGTLHAEALHVPLIIRLPGGEHGGRRVSDAVQLVDLFPTLLELAGQDPSAVLSHGRSLVPLMRGAVLPPATILSEGGETQGSAIEHDGWKLMVEFPSRAKYGARITHPLARTRLRAVAPELYDRSLRNRDIHRMLEERPAWGELLAELLGGAHESLYHVAQDPDETTDLLAERPDVAQRLRSRLAVERVRVEEARARARFDQGRDRMPAADLEQLRHLGYLGLEDSPDD